jgi:hypothetical protein
LPEWVEVSTQQELDAALARSNVIPICTGEGSFVVDGDATVRAADSATVRAAGAATVEAGGSASVDASGSSTVVVWDAVVVRAGDSVDVLAADDARVEASGSATVRALRRSTVVARDSAAVEAEHLTTVSASDSVAVMAWESATVEAAGDARVLAWDRAKVEASERAFVRAWGSATVRAAGSVTVEGWDRVTLVADPSVSVELWGAPDAAGELPPVSSAEEWCRVYGVEVEDGIATLFKSVNSDYTSRYGTSYAPGSLPSAPDWHEGERSCNGGLHLSPRPYLGLEFTHRVGRFVACPVRVEDIAVGRGPYRNKVRAKAACAPVYEVDDNGRPV